MLMAGKLERETFPVLLFGCFPSSQKCLFVPETACHDRSVTTRISLWWSPPVSATSGGWRRWGVCRCAGVVTAPHNTANTLALTGRVTLPLCFHGIQWATGIATLSLPLFHPFRWTSLPLLLPSPLQRITKPGNKWRRQLCPLPPPLPCSPRRHSCRVGSHRICFPWGHQASLHTAASLETFLKFQGGSEALQLKHPGDVATGHFVIKRKPPFFRPSWASCLRPPCVVGPCGSSHLGLS